MLQYNIKKYYSHAHNARRNAKCKEQDLRVLLCFRFVIQESDRALILTIAHRRIVQHGIYRV